MSSKIINVLKKPLNFIICTVIITSAIWGFFYYKMVELKDQKIDNLETQNEQLKEDGPVPQAIRELDGKISNIEKKLSPLLLLNEIDPIYGNFLIGDALGGPTKLTHGMNEAQSYVNRGKYDLALKKADEMNEVLPEFVGSKYIYYLVNKAKVYDDEIIKYAEYIIKNIPNDNRIKNVYETLIEIYIKKGKNKDAEDIAIKALNIWPDDKKLKEFFKRKFGYLPSVN